MKKMLFIDECQLELIAGKGGNGIIAWRREAHNALGGPSGGDGGKGGDIIICADENTETLFHLHRLKKIIADNGKNGQINRMTGKNGGDKVILVPIGTSIWDDAGNLICDLIYHQQAVTICHGGKPGLGNAHFKSAKNRAPSIYECGDQGEKKSVHLKLRFLANVGIIGLPNAGKSTLINVLSNAKSRVANYAFTTLVPVLGSVKYKDQKLLFADIPGLIENASTGKGLGHDFLKHIERCQILIHLISMDPQDNDDVLKAYNTILNELREYSSVLLQKKIIVVANKADTEGSDDNYTKLCQYLQQEILFISAKNCRLSSLLPEVFAKYNFHADQNKEPIVVARNYVASGTINQMDNLQIEKTNSGWKLVHPQLTYWLHRIPLTTPDNIQHFKDKLREIHLGEFLQKHGLQLDDKILIDEHEFSFSDFH